MATQNGFIHTTVISTVGTSMFTNKTTNEVRDALLLHANSVEAYVKADADAWPIVRGRVDEIRAALPFMKPENAQDQSAELNGIVKYGATGPDFSHYLLHTDTFLGEQAANIAAAWLASHNCRHAEPVRLAKMTTRNAAAFQEGVDALLQWCDALLPAMQHSRSKIVFNLVGGFKAMQAYCQTIGMLHADEILYTFEGKNADLIVIPRLPLRLHDDVFRKYATVSALLGKHETLSVAEFPEAGSFPEVYLHREIVGGVEYCDFSHWGRLAWDTAKREILKGSLVTFPGLQYAASFQKDYNDIADAATCVDAQETLAQVSRLWRNGGLQALRKDGGLQYETYTNRGNIGHFRLNQGNRMSCEPHGNLLVLRHIGSHDTVNSNP